MPAPTTITLNSPNVLNYAVGKGIVSIKFNDATPDADFVDIGDVSEFELTPVATKLDHYSSRGGIKSIDRTIVIESGLTVRMVMSEFTARNMGLAFLATPQIAGNVATLDILSEDVRNCAVRFRAENAAGPRWDFDLPCVQFAPSKAIQQISTTDGWDTLETSGAAVKVDNSYGTATCTFEDDAAPVLAAAPEIYGVAQVGHVLNIFPGTWTGSPPTFTYQWKVNAVDVAGATGSTYTPVSGDIGHPVTCVVHATNGFGTTTVTTAGTANVIA